MITLSLDTATPAPSLALLSDGDVLVERTLTAAPEAGRRVAEEIHLLLTEANVGVRELGEIVVGVGPGGFTGLRIGIATALGLGQALAIPVRGVASIEALALGIVAATPPGAIVAPVIDAKRQEVFAAAYRGVGDGGLEAIVEPFATGASGLGERLDEIATAAAPVYVGGDGLERCDGSLGDNVVVVPGVERISAVRLARRAVAGGARPVSPLYLRLPDAEVNRMRREREAAAT